jgi:hypothetical protein
MTRLNQIIAIEKGVRTQTKKDIDEAYKRLQKAPLMSGISRTYAPKDEEGDRLPPESTLLQVRAEDILASAVDAFAKLFAITVEKDGTNLQALANVVVDGVVLFQNAPVPYLLFLEKNLTDLHTLVAKLPILDPSERWVLDPNTGAYATEPTETTRTKKIPRNHVKAAATDKHPAQVEMYFEDVIVGTWKTVKFSGAVPQTRVNELLARIEKVQKAVKFAREEANSVEVQVNGATSRKILDYIFA